MNSIVKSKSLSNIIIGNFLLAAFLLNSCDKEIKDYYHISLDKDRDKIKNTKVQSISENEYRISNLDTILETSIIKEFNQNGYQIKEIHIDYEKNTFDTLVFEYNKQNHIEKITGLSSLTIFTYNKDHFLHQKYFYFNLKNGTYQDTLFDNFYYNKNGRMNKHSVLKPQGKNEDPKVMDEISYYYDEKGRIAIVEGGLNNNYKSVLNKFNSKDQLDSIIAISYFKTRAHQSYLEYNQNNFPILERKVILIDTLNNKACKIDKLKKFEYKYF